MPLDLLKLQAGEAEQIAYAEGCTMAAELFARIAAAIVIGLALCAVLLHSLDALFY